MRRTTDDRDDGRQDDGPQGGQGGQPQVDAAGDPFRVRQLAANGRRRQSPASGRRSRSLDTPHGPTVRSKAPSQPLTRFSDVALTASLQQMALRQARSGNGRAGTARLQSADLRQKVRAGKARNLILFVVDASGSMAARKRMVAVKGAILSLLIDAYQKRDLVGLITFRGRGAQLMLPPTHSAELAQQHLQRLPTGGRTPLTHGLQLAAETFKRTQHDLAIPLLVLVSDCKANVGYNAARPKGVLAESLQIADQLAHQRISSLVIDCEQGRGRLGYAKRVAVGLNGQCLRLDQLSAEALTNTVQKHLR